MDEEEKEYNKIFAKNYYLEWTCARYTHVGRIVGYI